MLNIHEYNYFLLTVQYINPNGSITIEMITYPTKECFVSSKKIGEGKGSFAILNCIKMNCNEFMRWMSFDYQETKKFLEDLGYV